MPKCAALPQIIELSDFGGNFDKYNSFLYNEIFKKQLYNKKIHYDGKVIAFKKYPEFQEREESFYHLTCKEYKYGCKDRLLDLRRSERLNWIKPSLETDHTGFCSRNCFDYYIKDYKGKKRIVLLNQEESYTIILEDRGSFYLLITAYFIEYKNKLAREIKALNIYKQQETP